MDLRLILDQLKMERQRITAAIEALERLARGGGGQKRRGRPPAWMKAMTQGNGN